ncbi:MAG: GyrI-like domain-containing protein [Paenibacillus sp.]|uniref:GyrI-like domain-containing protein n=1 Tax=Paenibacillus sp. TaxID=58172 RepID=UPI0025D1BE68|nr:GyrI-like domain-containing protein [Paenibacillus sp.]MBR2565333.1 GyrI-like domain-containing protein [Paenibacillus sp.]
MKPIQVAELIRKEAATMIGLKWEGTFAEAGAGGIRKVQTEFKRRLHEIQNVIHPEELLGLSYHVTDTGFVHYVAVRVGNTATPSVPEGMIQLEVPAHDYAKCSHAKGQSIESSYNRIYAWIEEQGLHLLNDPLTHYEVYPMEQDPYDTEPEFTILVPVMKGI